MRALGRWVVQHAWERWRNGAGHDADAATGAGPRCFREWVSWADRCCCSCSQRCEGPGSRTAHDWRSSQVLSRVLRTSTPSSVQRLWWHSPIVEAGVSRRCCPARRPGPNHGWRCQARRCQAWLAAVCPLLLARVAQRRKRPSQPTLVRMLRVHAAQGVGVCEVGQAVRYRAAALPAGTWPWLPYGCNTSGGWSQSCQQWARSGSWLHGRVQRLQQRLFPSTDNSSNTRCFARGLSNGAESLQQPMGLGLQAEAGAWERADAQRMAHGRQASAQRRPRRASCDQLQPSKCCQFYRVLKAARSIAS